MDPAAPGDAAAMALSEATLSVLVAAFYAKVRADGLLGPVFARAIGADDAAWARHLALIGDFWSSVLLGSGRYKGDPLAVHRRLDAIDPAMFERWLALFDATCAETLAPADAALLRTKAGRIGQSLSMGLFTLLPPRRPPG